MKTVVSVEGLDHWLGEGTLRRKVLSNVNFTLSEKELVILTGPSGSGKTTLLTLIGGLRSVQAGRLDVLGNRMNSLNQEQLAPVRRNVGYIFQAHNLLSFLTVRQNILMSLELHPGFSSDEAYARVNSILSDVGLHQHADKYPDQMSGGQKQRVAVARALIAQPRLVLADEPTAALDKASGRDVVNLLQDLARQGDCSILMVTHDNRILDVADRIVEMEDGKILTPALV
ncbi:MAG: ATP-binding cassette domain-containing protein [Candidatus Obscuribacterales bacterium]|nr:ATP-binding cassette domain-containing protein [Candidatus Obscuribacterales bacterium]